MHELYGRWLAGGATALGHGLRGEEVTELNMILGDVLRPAHETWEPSDPLAQGALAYDVRAPLLTRRAMLRELGWPGGEQPSVSDLVGHILDRLEYQCAYDIAFEEGEAGRLLGGGESAVSLPICVPLL